MPKPYSFTSVEGLLGHVFDLKYFAPNEKGETPIEHHWVRGTGNFVVCLGENASGKSFFRRLVTAVCREAKVEAMPISMEGRGGEYGGLKGFIYGSEDWQSTGENSSNTVLMGIETCRARTTPHVLFLDEPDLGLSDGWAAGMGAALREFALQLPVQTLGAFVVTHSRSLTRQLLPCDPHYLYFGSNPPPTIKDWVDAPVSPLDLASLGELSHRRFKLIQTILDEVEKKNR